MGKTNVITRELFEEMMDFIIESEQATSALDNVYSEYRNIFGDAEAPVPVYIDKILRLMEAVLDLPVDEFGNTTLSWWVYDGKCGEDLDIIQSIENNWLPEDHKYRNPDLTSVGKLYDYICWESQQNAKEGEK